MRRQALRTVAFTSFALVVLLGSALHAQAQDAKEPYPTMAQLDQYLMERDAEIALARSAAPESISHDADVMVLGRHGYETAVKGKNGFVCVVQRSWAAGIDDPDFWNPKLRAPICFNPPAARFNRPAHDQENRVGIGWTIQSSGVRGHQSRFRQEGSALAGGRRDVLHDGKATVLERP